MGLDEEGGGKRGRGGRRSSPATSVNELSNTDWSSHTFCTRSAEFSPPACNSLSDLAVMCYEITRYRHRGVKKRQVLQVVLDSNDGPKKTQTLFLLV